MIAQQVDGVFARITAFHNGDQSQVLADEAVDEAGKLWRTARPGSSDLGVPFYVVVSIAVLHWCRYRVMPEGRDHDDLQVAAVMYSHVLTVDPDPVPEALQETLATAGVENFEDNLTIPSWAEQSYVATQYPSSTSAATANGPTWLARRAEVILRRPDLNAALQNEALGLLRQAAEAAPTVLSDQAEYLLVIGRTLLARFQKADEGGEVATDLDEAIEALRSAVQHAPRGHVHRIESMTSLGRALTLRFDRMGRQSDYDEATSMMAALRREGQSS